MGSCTCVEICPQCGKETLVVDFDLNTEEIDSFCEFCGYKHFNHIKKDEAGNPIYSVSEYPINKVHIGAVSYLDGIVKPIMPISDIKDVSVQKIIDIFDKKNGKGFYSQSNANNLLFVNNFEIEVLLSSNCSFEFKEDKLMISKLLFEESTTNTFGHVLACDGEIIYQENLETSMTKEEAMSIVNQKLLVNNIEWVFASWYNCEAKQYEILFESKPGIIIQ